MNPEDIAAQLPAIIYKHITPAQLDRVVRDQGVISEVDYNVIRVTGGGPLETAQSIVAKYGRLVGQLALGLYEQVAYTNRDAAYELLALAQSSMSAGYYNAQASLVTRVPDVSMEGIAQFAESVRWQICLIACQAQHDPAVRLGTGFLVAPNLVLTCRHVLGPNMPVLEEPLPADYKIEVCFDFFGGSPVKSIASPIPARAVGLVRTADWCVTHKPWNVADPWAGVPDDEQIADIIKKSLDFVLLKLNENVGEQTVSRYGGRRRGWISVPITPAADPPEWADWIIIPQHPEGYPQRIGLGRFDGMDTTNTRIRYSTNTAQGASGSPCFNHRFQLVGLHNAALGVNRTYHANQGVLFTLISELIEQHTSTPGPMTPSRRWSTSRESDAPSVIIGRATLLDWISNWKTDAKHTMRERVYAALAERPQSGCTFSIDVLEAETRDNNAPRIIFGSRDEILSPKAEDFVTRLVEGLDLAGEPPKRPGAGAPGDPEAEVDKLNRWLSKELPEWIGDAIEARVQAKITLNEVAKEVLADLDPFNSDNNDKDVFSELRELADSEELEEADVLRWPCAYVIIDELRSNTLAQAAPRAQLSEEVANLVASLIKPKSGQRLHKGLRRLRWLFLGALPDFVVASDGADEQGATVEILDTAKVGKNDILDILARVKDTRFPLAPETETASVQDTAAVAAMVVAGVDAATDMSNRLRVLQLQINVYAGELLNHRPETAPELTP